MPRLLVPPPLSCPVVFLAFGLALAGTSSLVAQQESTTAPTPTPADLLVQAGVKSLSQGKFVDAEETFRKLAEVEPDRFRSALGLAEAYVGQKRGDEALRVLQSAIQKYPANPELHVAVGNLAMLATNYDAAIGEYQQALDRIDRNSKGAAEVYVRMAGAYNRKGDTEFALILLRQAQKLQPANASLLEASAGLLMVSGQIPAAQAEYRKLLEINPNNGLALNNLAFMTASSDPHLALAYALRARQLVPEEPAVIDTVGWVYLKLNQVDQALALFREVVEKDPRRAAYRYHLAAALEQKGDHDAARKEAERASKSAPSKEEEQEINELLRKLRQ